jgi:hypothetical protein
MSGYADDESRQAFARSRACFEQIAAGLAAAEADEQDHARLEERLAGEGRELLRQLLQDHLDLRAVREQRLAPVVDAEQVGHGRVEPDHQRGLVTVFGQVTVARVAYRASGARNLYPADAVLNLPAGLHSHGLRRLVAVESVRGSFETAAEAVERHTGVRIGKRQVEALAQDAAADVEAFYAARRPEPVDPDRLLVLSFDGKGVVMIPSGLREATAKAARQARRKLSTRLSPGEKTGRKRMAELACVYDAVPQVRTPSDVIGPPRDKPGAKPRRRPRATGKWLTASVVDDIATVIAAGFDEATRRDPGHERTWVVLVDGNNTQIDAITAEAGRRGVSVHIVCDLVHVLEYLWKAAWALFYTGDPAAEAWVADQATKILDGKAGQVAAGIRRRATQFGYSAKERAGADQCADYLSAKKPYLGYDTALTKGWPIATGVIEGACRHLVKDRMDITGARWSLPGAEAILRLRALVANGDFDVYWAFHLRQEHQRIHWGRYQHYRNEYILAA